MVVDSSELKRLAAVAAPFLVLRAGLVLQHYISVCSSDKALIYISPMQSTDSIYIGSTTTRANAATCLSTKRDALRIKTPCGPRLQFEGCVDKL